MDTSQSASKELLLDSDDEVTVRPAGRPGDCRSCWQLVTVEPCLMLYFLGTIALTPLTNQYVLNVLHQQNNFSTNSSGCVHNASDPNYILEQSLQAQASNMVTLYSLSGVLPSILVTTQLGAYSDKVGRKLALFWPLVGAILRCLLFVFVVRFQLPLWVLILAYGIEGVSGGIPTFIMAAFSYIADVTSHKERSLRIVILEVAIEVGVIGSQVGVGYLIAELGYMWPLVILCSLLTVNLLYVLFVVRETVTRDLGARFWSLENYKRMIVLYTRDDGSGRWWKLLVGLFMLFLVCVVGLGGLSVLTFYQLDSPICFDSVDIGLWQAARSVIISVSGIVMLQACRSRIGDTGLMVVGSVCYLGFSTSVAFITTRIGMYIASVGTICNWLLIPMVRSFSSKLVSSDEQGTMFSAIANVQTVSILVGNVALNSIYSATVQPPHFKGTVFLVEAGIIAVSLVSAVGLIIGSRIEKRHKSRSESITQD